MLYARGNNNEKILAEPKADGSCHVCDQKLQPKCGRIKTWHWSHKQRLDCDPWFEPETKWHLDWKSMVRPENVEVVIGNHRADIVGNQSLVIELQHSAISPDEIQEREEFYKNMIWVLDATVFSDNFVIYKKFNYSTFRWKWPRKSWDFANCPLILDLGNDRLFEIKEMYPSEPEEFIENFDSDGNRIGGSIKYRKPCRGWGQPLEKWAFLFRHLRGLLRKGDVSP